MARVKNGANTNGGRVKTVIGAAINGRAKGITPIADRIGESEEVSVIAKRESRLHLIEGTLTVGATDVGHGIGGVVHVEHSLEGSLTRAIGIGGLEGVDRAVIDRVRVDRGRCARTRLNPRSFG